MDFLEYLANPWIWAIVILFVFGGLGLMVGVTNDAVNFLNSALGSRVASKKTIFRIAAIGICIGAAFSGGMMEIARNGLFNPSLFTFYDIVIAFFSIMVVNIILLDIFNSLKLPTSTTVVVVFELLGAGLAIALLHLVQDDLRFSELTQFINASSAITIIIGIFLSVVIAFAAGWLIQNIVRALVSFDYGPAIRSRGWLYGGVSLAAMLYFLIVKGLQKASRMPSELLVRVDDYTLMSMLAILIISSLFAFLYQVVFRRGILKFIILFGTFSLAAAFAGNDLVNFIGVPIAGFQAIMIYLGNGLGMDQLMVQLAEPMITPQIFLIISAIIMAIALLTSKKATAVADTSIALTKHATGQERFKPGRISRWLVKKSIVMHKTIMKYLPHSRQEKLSLRFVKNHTTTENTASFDYIRASTTLTISAILIAIATSFKLPLSTTYVTFMVAMGAALADGARGRDSAVYRISGVITIIGSWLLTAVVSLVGAMLLTIALRYLGFRALGVALLIVGYVLYRSYFKKKDDLRDELVEVLSSAHDLSDILYGRSVDILSVFAERFQDIVTALVHENEKQLITLHQETQATASHTKHIKGNIHRLFSSLEEDATLGGHTYVQGVERLRRAALALNTIALESKEYVQNNHPEFLAKQHKELTMVAQGLQELLDESLVCFENKSYSLKAFDKKVDDYIQSINLLREEQFTRIKSGKAGVRNTTLYTTLLAELDSLVLNVQKLLHYLRKM